MTAFAEMYPHALDVFLACRLLRGRRAAGKPHVERPQVAQAHALPLQQMVGHMLLQAGDHGQDVVACHGALCRHLPGQVVDVHMPQAYGSHVVAHVAVAGIFSFDCLIR